jgi:molybdopterin adenylyltransferase
MPVRLAILTVSDAAARGARVDASGDAIEGWALGQGYSVVAREVVPDDHVRIRARLEEWADAGDVDVALTTGGTGFTERDVTPEATRAAVVKDAPGIAEALRARGAQATPYSWLSRGVAGIRGRTLIVNLPGSPGGVRDGLGLLATLIPHAVQLLADRDTHLHPDHD